MWEKKQSCPHHISFYYDRIDLIKIKSNFAPDLKFPGPTSAPQNPDEVTYLSLCREHRGPHPSSPQKTSHAQCLQIPCAFPLPCAAMVWKWIQFWENNINTVFVNSLFERV